MTNVCSSVLEKKKHKYHTEHRCRSNKHHGQQCELDVTRKTQDKVTIRRLKVHNGSTTMLAHTCRFEIFHRTQKSWKKNEKRKTIGQNDVTCFFLLFAVQHVW